MRAFRPARSCTRWKASEIVLRQLFETAYETNWTPVYRFALAWTNDREEAMDAAQETFARIWERRHAIDLSGDIVPLAITVERRLLTDRWRALRRRMRLHVEPARTWSASDSDEWADVQAAFARLTNAERVAITATTLSGLSYAEVGDALGITEGAARAAASRGRRKLAEARQA